MAAFRRRPEYELDDLSDEKLIAYAVGAREAGDREAESTALAVLAWGLIGFIQAVVAERVPIKEVEDVAGDVVEGALKSLKREGARFQGSTQAEFRGWLRRIAYYKRADHLDTKSREVKTTILPSEHTDDDGVWGKEPSVGDPNEALGSWELFAVEIAKLDPAKQRVVELNVFEDLASRDIADRVNEELPGLDPPMTPANVDQIISRFRKDLRGKLD